MSTARKRLRGELCPGDGRGWRKHWHRATCSRCYGSGGGGGELTCPHCNGKGDVWARKAAS
mgnify:CR=1 FL=1